MTTMDYENPTHPDVARFEWHSRSPDPVDVGPREKGFETALALALDAEGNRIGWVRASWVPEEFWEKTYPNPAYWYAHWHGLSSGVVPTADELWYKLVRHEKMPYEHRLKRVPAFCVKREDVPDPATRDAGIAAFGEEVREDFECTRAYFSIPHVAFARVQGGNWKLDANGDFFFDKGYWGRGIGTVLYGFAAAMLARDGKILMQGGSQTTEADKLWERLKTCLPVVKVTQRHVYLEGVKEKTYLAVDMRKTACKAA